ncbi:MAG: hypothetical protein ACK417_10680 [Bacteroidia bacterium]
MAFVLVTVSYYPDEGLVQRLKAALDMSLAVWVFDNTPGGSPLLHQMQGHAQFHYRHRDHGNIGLGPAMRSLFQLVAEQGVDKLLYFDQDTLFTANTLVWMAEWLAAHRPVDFAAIQFTSTATDTTVALPQPTRHRLLINSGCLFYLRPLAKIGWHDADFFVEGVDYKFCLDAAYHKYLLGMIATAPDIDHEQLQPMTTRYFLGRHYRFRKYPWLRRKNFSWALLRLAGKALQRGQWAYGYVFLRNLLSLWVSQAFFDVLFYFGKPQNDG